MPTNAAIADELRWKKFPVLDDGFVCLVDVMGDDQAVVQAARVSYGEGTRKVSDDRGLIRYLMRHRHTHAVRNGGNQVPGARADGLLAAVDSPSHGQRERIQHALFAGHRRHANHAARRMAHAGSHKSPRKRRAARRNRSAKIFPPRKRNFKPPPASLYEERIAAGVAREQARKDLPLVDVHRSVLENRPAQPAPLSGAADGRPRAARNSRLRNERSASKSCSRCSRWFGKRLSIIAWKRCFSRGSIAN